MASQNRMMTLIPLQGTELLESDWTVASSGDDAIDLCQIISIRTCVGGLDPIDPVLRRMSQKGAEEQFPPRRLSGGAGSGLSRSAEIG
jgi:hypothetical protein